MSSTRAKLSRRGINELVSSVHARANSLSRSLYRRFPRSADMEICQVRVCCTTVETTANDYERSPEAGKERRKLRRVTQIPQLRVIARECVHRRVPVSVQFLPVLR